MKPKPEPPRPLGARAKSDALAAARISRSRRSHAALLFCSLIITAIAVLSTGCDPGHDVRYVNSTDQRLTILVDGAKETTVGPMESVEVLTLEYPGASTFEAENDQGLTVYSEALTWNQLRQRGWEILIVAENNQRS